MLTKPCCGWSEVTLGNFKSCASYLDDLPFNWLRAFRNGFEHNIPVALDIDEEGSHSIIVTYYDDTYVVSDRGEGAKTLETVEGIDFLDVAYMLICDINDNFEDWVTWDHHEYPENEIDLRRNELRQLLDETGEYLSAYAKKMNKHFK